MTRQEIIKILENEKGIKFRFENYCGSLEGDYIKFEICYGLFERDNNKFEFLLCSDDFTISYRKNDELGSIESNYENVDIKKTSENLLQIHIKFLDNNIYITI